MDSNLTQLLKEHHLKAVFLPTHGKGFLIRTPKGTPNQIVINSDLSEKEVENVILHEIGHLKHDDTRCDYKDDYGVRIGSEREANNFMIHEQVAKYVALGNDILSSNYVDLANGIGTHDYNRVKSELEKYLVK